MSAHSPSRSVEVWLHTRNAPPAMQEAENGRRGTLWRLDRRRGGRRLPRPNGDCGRRYGRGGRGLGLHRRPRRNARCPLWQDLPLRTAGRSEHTRQQSGNEAVGFPLHHRPARCGSSHRMMLPVDRMFAPQLRMEHAGSATPVAFRRRVPPSNRVELTTTLPPGWRKGARYRADPRPLAYRVNRDRLASPIRFLPSRSIRSRWMTGPTGASASCSAQGPIGRAGKRMRAHNPLRAVGVVSAVPTGTI